MQKAVTNITNKDYVLETLLPIVKNDCFFEADEVAQGFALLSTCVMTCASHFGARVVCYIRVPDDPALRPGSMSQALAASSVHGGVTTYTDGAGGDS